MKYFDTFTRPIEMLSVNSVHTVILYFDTTFNLFRLDRNSESCRSNYDLVELKMQWSNAVLSIFTETFYISRMLYWRLRDLTGNVVGHRLQPAEFKCWHGHG